MKRRLWQYLIGYLISILIIVGVVVYEVVQLERPLATMWSHIFYDATFIVAALFIGIWLLVIIGNNGLFDVFSYSFKRFGSRLFRKDPRFSNVPKTFYEYRQLKEEEEPAYINYLAWIALSWAIVLAIFATLYHCGIGHIAA